MINLFRLRPVFFRAASHRTYQKCEFLDLFIMEINAGSLNKHTKFGNYQVVKKSLTLMGFMYASADSSIYYSKDWLSVTGGTKILDLAHVTPYLFLVTVFIGNQIPITWRGL